MIKLKNNITLINKKIVKNINQRGNNILHRPSQ